MAKQNRSLNNVVVNMGDRAVALGRRLFGNAFNQKRDTDNVFGYKKLLQWEDYREAYERYCLANRIVNAYPDATWDNKIRVTDDNEAETETEFEMAFSKLARRSRLFNYLNKADKLANIGHYSVLLLGVRDGEKDLSKPIGSVKDYEDLLFLQAFDQDNAQIQTWNEDISDPNYQLPKLYTLQTGDDYQRARGVSTGSTIPGKTFPVHHSRVIHIAEGTLADDIYGIPRLKPIMNRLVDLEKVTGGAAEVLYLNGRGGIHVNVTGLQGAGDKGSAVAAAMGADASKKLKEQVDTYTNSSLERFIFSQGADVNVLNHPVVAPDKHASVILEQIAGAVGIPKRILVGSERGELASTQDETQWLGRIKERREQFAEPMILRPLIDRFIEIGLLPTPMEDDYHIIFPELTNISEKDRAEIRFKNSQALVGYANSMSAQTIVPEEQFMDEIMGMEFKGEAIEDMEQEVSDTIAEDNAELDNQSNE